MDLHEKEAMYVCQCVKSLSSLRNYIEKEVPDEIIAEVLEAGRLAPSAHNNQPWEFVLVKNRDALRQLSKYCTSGKFVAQAGFAVVIVVDPENKWYQIDGTRAAQNMVITAWGWGLGSCWIGRIEKDELKKHLAVPQKLDILTVLPFGYFDRNFLSSTKKARKSPDDVIHIESYGKNFSTWLKTY